MTEYITLDDVRVEFTPRAIALVQHMHASVRALRSFYGDTHPVTVEAQSSFTNSLVTVIGIGGTISVDGEMLVGTNNFGFTFGMLAHKRNVPDEYVKVYDAPTPLTFSVNS